MSICLTRYFQFRSILMLLINLRCVSKEIGLCYIFKQAYRTAKPPPVRLSLCQHTNDNNIVNIKYRPLHSIWERIDSCIYFTFETYGAPKRRCEQCLLLYEQTNCNKFTICSNKLLICFNNNNLFEQIVNLIVNSLYKYLLVNCYCSNKLAIVQQIVNLFE